MALGGKLNFNRLAALLIGAVGIAIYANSLLAPFLFDDMIYLVNNERIQSLWPIWETLGPQGYGNWRPMLSLSFALNYQLHGGRVLGYHIVNLGLFLLTGWLLFRFLTLLFQQPAFRERTGSAAGGLALAAVLVWLSHPIQTEAVTYITQRSGLLMGFFFLIALIESFRSFEPGAPARHQWFAWAACVAGMLSREEMAAAPLIILAFDRLFISGTFRRAWRNHRRLHLGLLACWGILPPLLAFGPKILEIQMFPRLLSPWNYLLTQSGVLLHYLRLILWPDRLTLDYLDWPIAQHLSEVWLPATAILALLIGTAWGFWKRRAESAVGVWCFFLLAPTSSFLPIISEVAAERRVYLPLAALSAAAALAVWRLLGRLKSEWTRQLVGMGLTAAIVLGLGIATVRRNETYQTSIAIWEDTARKRPNNSRAQLNLGQAYLAAGRWEEGYAHTIRTLELDPRAGAAYNNLGLLAMFQHDFDRAIELFQIALALDPGYAVYWKTAEHLETAREIREKLAEDPTLLDHFPEPLIRELNEMLKELAP
ncbi:MAG: hypothetical protein COV76_06920 [Candidatus Omnitrophica bacterium CG11_big_fil_rev_8_21_14_0_20_64_10]|nr:MAG: hypothetical protein COV76_06920 [Candidatus Omnitrophica bacterium CG11_big_fil_rev_8_21_14_0_20_64_10]